MTTGERLRRTAALVAGLTLVAAACTNQSGQSAGSGDAEAAKDYPKRAISWIVPYAPGGGSDRQVRRLQPYVEKSLGQQINVVYKEGGDGAVGWQQLGAAKADGYTIANVVAPNAMVLERTGKTGYESKKFEYVAWTETAPNVLVVSAKSRYKSVDEFVRAAKERPGKLTVAGTGKTGELSWAEMSKSMGTKASYVPVSGGVGDIVPDLQGGHVDAAVFGASHAMEHKNELRPLAITGTKKVDAMPNVPTLESAGYGRARLGTSWGVIAPPDTPTPIVQKLNAAVRKAVRQKKVEDQLRKHGLRQLDQTPKQARAYATAQDTQLDSVDHLLGD